MKTKKKKQEQIINKTPIYTQEVYWNLLGACSNNINELVKSAKILLENDIFSKSFLMSSLALEELGKRLAICDYIEDIISQDEFKKIFRDHDLKIAYLHNKCILTKPEDNTTLGCEATITYDLKKYHEFFIEKQKATYVDFNSQDETYTTPSLIITKTDAEKIYNYVIKIIQDTNYYEDVTERIGTKAFLK